jgi:nitrite reductase/ring-hydroxylating ferredoxin subunit
MTVWRAFPFMIEVSAGDTKAFCLCGLSKNAPYCDCSHTATEVTPAVITFDEDETVFVCGCGLSAKLPFCDGAHRALKEETEGAHWHKVAERGVLGERQPRVVRAGGRAIALFRVDGGYFALADDCPLDGASLGEGTVDARGYLCCPRHGRGFRPEDGKGTRGADVEPFPVQVRKDGVYVRVEAEPE